MKIKSGFITRKIGNKIVGVAVGERSKEFNGMIDLNESAEFIWKCLEKDTTAQEIAQKVSEHYDIDIEKATNATDIFIKALKENNLIEE